MAYAFKKSVYIGRKFHMMTVISFSHRDPRNKHHYFFKCRCDCGNEKTVRISGLYSGTTKSCGCYFKRRMQEIQKGNTYRRLSFGEAASKALFGRYKREAKRRKIPFEITFDQFLSLTGMPCYYCGKLPANISRDKNGYGHFQYTGIDRADNATGYSLGNCVPCCKQCNSMKNGVSKEMVEKLYHLLFKPVQTAPPQQHVV